MNLYLGDDAKWHIGVEIPEEAHSQSAMHLLGMSGFGKSTLMASIAWQCWQAGEGVVVVDIKDGELTQELAKRIPPDRLDDVVYIAPGLTFYPTERHPGGEMHYYGLNVLEYRKDGLTELSRTKRADEVITNVMDMFTHMEHYQAGFTNVSTNLKAAAGLALARPDGTLVDIRKIMTEDAYRQWMLANYRTHPEIRRHWERFDTKGVNTPHQKQEAVKSTVSRVFDIISSTTLNYTVSQPHSTIEFAKWLDAGKLVLINLGEELSVDHVDYGNLLMALLVNAIFQRSNPERTWRFCIDEFDLLATDQFAKMIKMARSFKVLLVASNQSLGQLKRPGNNRNALYTAAQQIPIKIRFHLSDEDKQELRWIHPEATITEMAELKRYSFHVEVAGAPSEWDFPITVNGSNFWADLPVHEGSLDHLIAAQQALTKPASELGPFNMKRYYAPVGGNNGKRDHYHNRNQANQNFTTGARPGRQDPPPGGDPPGTDDPADARQAAGGFKRSVTDDL